MQTSSAMLSKPQPHKKPQQSCWINLPDTGQVLSILPPQPTGGRDLFLSFELRLMNSIGRNKSVFDQQLRSPSFTKPKSCKLLLLLLLLALFRYNFGYFVDTTMWIFSII